MGPDDEKVLIIPEETLVESLAPSPSTSRPASSRTTTTESPIEDSGSPGESRSTSAKSSAGDALKDDDDIEDSLDNEEDMDDLNVDMGESPPIANDDMDDDDDMD